MRSLAAALALAVALGVVSTVGAPLVALGLGAAPVERGDWFWPVAPPRSIARPFIAPTTEYGPGHRGIDVRASNPTLFAPADGIVHFAGVVVSRPVLSIRHGASVISSFEPVVALFAAGDAVSRGQPIGTIVAGHCATACVHVGVRVDGEYVSPLAWFGGIPRSILLPTRWDVVARLDAGMTAPGPRLATTTGRRESVSRTRTAPSRRSSATWSCAPRPRPRSRDPATRTSRRA